MDIYCPPKFEKGGGPQKFHPLYHLHLTARYVAKSCGVIPLTPEVIGAHLLKFKPNLAPLSKNCKGTPPSMVWGVLATIVIL